MKLKRITMLISFLAFLFLFAGCGATQPTPVAKEVKKKAKKVVKDTRKLVKIIACKGGFLEVKMQGKEVKQTKRLRVISKNGELDFKPSNIKVCKPLEIAVLMPKNFKKSGRGYKIAFIMASNLTPKKFRVMANKDSAGNYTIRVIDEVEMTSNPPDKVITFSSSEFFFVEDEGIMMLMGSSFDPFKKRQVKTVVEKRNVPQAEEEL